MKVDRCDECGFTYTSAEPTEVVARLVAAGDGFVAVLATDVDHLRDRPEPDTWSALEYSCHVRDVLLAQRERLYLALVEEQPSFAPIDRDERVVLAHYNERQPSRVARELAAAVGLFADAFVALDHTQRARTCVDNYPEPTVRTLDWPGLHTVHECDHHFADAHRSLGTSAAS